MTKSLAISIATAIFLITQMLFPINANADWRKDVGTFRIGVVSRGNLEDTYARIEPFRLAIAEALGVNVEIFVARNYRTLINAQIAARIEYAIYSASAYATTWKLCECVEPLVVPKSLAGSESYQSVVISSSDGPNDISELGVSKLTALSKNSFAGHKFAIFELKNKGIPLPKETAFFNSGEDAIDEFVAGKFNAIIGWSTLVGDPGAGYSNGTFRLIAERNKGTSAPYRIIWKSSPIPNRPHVIRKNLAGEAKMLLRGVLDQMVDNDPVAYDAIEPVFGGGFVVARHGQFLPIIAYINSIAPKEEKAESN